MSERDQLQVPPAVERDAGSFEILRVWIAERNQHACIRIGVWPDPAAWGVMLADLMHHIADAHHAAHGLERESTMQRMKAGLDAELATPTDKLQGKVENS